MRPAPFPPIDDTARCRQPGLDPEAFHPPQGANAHSVGAAKRRCNGWPSTGPCPFRDACREYGLTHAVSGIWGGLSEDERKHVRSRRRIVPVPMPSFGAYPKKAS